MREMTEATFGNWTSGIQFDSLMDKWATIDIPKYVNISVFDNISTYGDNRADVRLYNDIVGFTQDEVIFNYINHYYITSAVPNLFSREGDFIYLVGTGFQNTPALNCKFGHLLATSVKYYNSTHIHCGTPFFTDMTIDYSVAVTLNGIEYLYYIDPTTKAPYKLVFTEPIIVLSLDPILGFANTLD